MSTKDEIFDYVMNSPENTNPAVEVLNISISLTLAKREESHL